MQAFELPEIARILKLDLAKAKNWTNGRTGLVIEPSVRKATGTGTRNIYSLQDVYLMAVAQQFSRAGFAAKAIGRLMEAVRPMVDVSAKRDEVWVVRRIKPAGPFHIERGNAQPAASFLWHTLEIGRLLADVDEATAKFEKGR